MKKNNMIPDTLFPTDNPQEIPVLNPDLQAGLIDFPFVAWGSVSRTDKQSGTWHFYVDDYRFSALWDKADMVPNTGCISAVEVNYSITEQMPYPVALYRIYQKRWLSRYWQSQGIRIVADLNVARPYIKLNFLGIPRGWTTYATHGHNELVGDLEIAFNAAVENAGTKNIYFLVYGGGALVKEYCRKHKVIKHVEEYRSEIAAALGG